MDRACYLESERGDVVLPLSAPVALISHGLLKL